MSLSINKYHGNYNISNRNTAVKYIVVHYVGAGSHTDGNAKNNCIYFSGGNRNASAHYFIDDGGIWEYADPDKYATWHCGDGGGAYGITNQNSVGIEVCINGDNPFTDTEIKYLTELVQYLMKKYGVPVGNVVRHYDASRKACPYYYAGTGARQTRWENLRKQITGGSTGSTGNTGSTTTKPSTPSTSTPSGSNFGGTYMCTVAKLNVRDTPSTKGNVVASYTKGQTVVLDNWYKSADGYIWGRYTGATSGKTRYVAVGKATGKPESDDYLVKI